MKNKGMKVQCKCRCWGSETIHKGEILSIYEYSKFKESDKEGEEPIEIKYRDLTVKFDEICIGCGAEHDNCIFHDGDVELIEEGE